ncbi:MAG: TonB-dependent receptor, partial [Bacteroidota bacterium]
MRFLFLLTFNCILFTCWSQDKYTISGYIKDAVSGETLISANVYSKTDINLGVVSNTYGYFALTLPEGEYEIVFSYLGYGDEIRSFNLKNDIIIDIELQQGVLVEEIVVTAEEENEAIQNTEMGTIEMDVLEVKKIPAIFGEVDVLKSLQLLPGVSSVGEGNAGFYVRGGGPDQNLVLLDEAVVYNSGHMLGFFSVFNPDAIKNTTLIKGGMPANYGGRLSSVVDIQMKDGNDQKFSVEGGIGIIASRLTLQGPIDKGKTSFILTGRRTYLFDLLQPVLNQTDFAGTNYYFYDLNAKINHRFSDKDRLFFSAYFGRDKLIYNQENRGFGIELPYGNATATIRWNHLFSDKLFMNISGIYNKYDFKFAANQDAFTGEIFSGVEDLNGKIDFDYFLNPSNHLKFGVNYTYHTITPNILDATDGNVEFTNDLMPKYGHEYAAYLLNDFKMGSSLKFNLGLRISGYTQVGPYESIEGQTFGSGEKVKSFAALEPRFGFNYTLNESTSIKGGLTFSTQYLHLVSNSTSTLPADVWVSSSELVDPQKGIQYALGFFKNFDNGKYVTSLEVYYKDLQNQIDFRESYVDNAKQVEDEFVFGQGRSYGAELFLKKAKGRLNGWLGYTLSRTERWFDEIENGRVFPTTYDRTHDLSIVLNYAASKKWDLGLAFVFGTGRAFTPIESVFFIEQRPNTNYGPRNSARLEDYHRLDLSATYTPKPDTKKNFKSSWTFSVYNAYNRKNPF